MKTYYFPSSRVATTYGSDATARDYYEWKRSTSRKTFPEWRAAREARK